LKQNNKMDGLKIEKVGIEHEDECRFLSAIFNGDFIAKQIKIIRIKQDSLLGNHYHDYFETFFLLHGEAEYTFEDIFTKEKEKHHIKAGDRITIKPKIAHKALLKAGTVMIEGTGEQYVSAEVNDHPYTVE